MRKSIPLAILASLALVAGILIYRADVHAARDDAAGESRRAAVEAGQLAAMHTPEPAWPGFIPPTPDNGPAGIYVFYDYSNVNPNLYPFIRGGHLTPMWRHLEIGPQTYDWFMTDNFIAQQASLGKRVGLGVDPYEGT